MTCKISRMSKYITFYFAFARSAAAAKFRHYSSHNTYNIYKTYEIINIDYGYFITPSRGDAAPQNFDFTTSSTPQNFDFATSSTPQNFDFTTSSTPQNFDIDILQRQKQIIEHNIGILRRHSWYFITPPRDAAPLPPPPKKSVLTEDLGKIFEMAICLLYETEYDGKYKYSMEKAINLKEKLYKLKNEFPFKIKHIAKNGNRYDFVNIDDFTPPSLGAAAPKNFENVYLSAKTTKKDAKVCPQVIGQPSKKKFCQFFDLDPTYDLDQIKNYIETNINQLLEVYSANTFDCPIVYYNKHKKLMLFIKLKNNINWINNEITFSHIVKNKKWNESSCIMINNITIGEFQIHNNRDCIKFRWCFEKLLNLFKDHFDIIEI